MFFLLWTDLGFSLLLLLIILLLLKVGGKGCILNGATFLVPCEHAHRPFGIFLLLQLNPLLEFKKLVILIICRVAARLYLR